MLYVKILTILIVGIIPSACSSSSYIGLPKPVTADIHAEFPYTWMSQLNFAVEDFEKTSEYKKYKNSDLGDSCFTIITRSEDNKFYIAILPRVTVKDEGEFVVTLGPQDSDYCGNGISYEFDNSGKFLRKIYQR